MSVCVPNCAIYNARKCWRWKKGFALDKKALRPYRIRKGAAVDDLADRVGQGRDLAQGVDDGPDALGRQGQAVDQARPHARGAGALQVGPVGGQDARGRLHEMVGHGAQPGVLELCFLRKKSAWN